MFFLIGPILVLRQMLTRLTHHAGDYESFSSFFSIIQNHSHYGSPKLVVFVCGKLGEYKLIIYLFLFGMINGLEWAGSFLC